MEGGNVDPQDKMRKMLDSDDSSSDMDQFNSNMLDDLGNQKRDTIMQKNFKDLPADMN